MATSVNGWPVYKSAPSGTIPYITGRIRPGDVDDIFTYLCAELDKVEKNRPEWCWGWAYRPIRGATSGFSNHASATAIDYNAPAHPLGVRGSWTAEEIRKIDAILRELDGVVFWGEHYQNRKDGMHFEIVGSAARCSDVASKIRAGQLRGQKPAWRPKEAKAIHFGRTQEQFLIAANAQRGKLTQSNGVGLIQKALNEVLKANLTPDGYCGEKTLNAWGRFEEKHGGSGRPRVPDRTSVEKLAKMADLDITGEPWG